MYNDNINPDAVATPPHAASYHYFPVTQWSNEQVLEWLRGVCHENNIDSGNLVGFADCTGHQLCSMTLHQFTELHPLHGSLFYKKLRDYIENQQRQDHKIQSPPPHHPHHITHPPEHYHHPYRHSQQQHPHPHHHHHHHHHHHQPSPRPPPPIHIIQQPMNGTTYHELLPRHPNFGHWQDAPPQNQGSGPFYPSEAAPSPAPDHYGGPGQPMGACQTPYPIPYEFEAAPLSPSVPQPPMHPHGYLPCPPLPHAGAPSPPAPPTAASPLSCQQDARRDRGPKLWEFLLDLLDDTTSNPSIIRWENHEERTFRLTNPHEVAFRWGQRRPNQNSLPYDYFARALRYHYKTGMLISVPERKLVYKFGRAVFQQRRRGPNTPLPYNPDSPSPADTPTGHHPS